MAKKCILLVRVSTTSKQQEISLDEQSRELRQLALEDGYEDNNIILISDQESGLKRFYAKTDDEKDEVEIERHGLRVLEKYIEEDSSIDCVYVWELSRISRRERVLFKYRDLLIDKGIQLIIKSPYQKLLLPDGTVDTTAKLMFGIFTTLAAAEMDNKQSRFARNRIAKRRDGKYTGGKILWGYAVAQNKDIIIDEVEGEKVRTLFNLFLTGNYSVRSLNKEAKERGLLKPTNKDAELNRLLKNKAYCGGQSYYKLKGGGFKYPPIVSEEMIDECIKIMKGNVCKQKFFTKKKHFGRGIIRCPHCGILVNFNAGEVHYKCNTEGCRKLNVNGNMVDSILLRVALDQDRMYTILDRANKEKELKDNNSILEEKIETAKRDILNRKNRIKTIEEKVYIDGTLSIERGEEFIGKLNNELNELQQLLLNYNNTINYNMEMLNELKSRIIIPKASIEDVDDETADKIIHKYIETAFIDKIKRFQYTISIYRFNAYKPFIYGFNTRFNIITRHGDIEPIPILKRFERREKKGKPEGYWKAYYQKNKEKLREKNREYARQRRERKKAQEAK